MDSAFTRFTSCLLLPVQVKVRSGQYNQKPLSSELAVMNGCRTYLLPMGPMERYTFHVALSTHGNYSLQHIDAKQHVILFALCIFEILLPT
jgi:hypothetical protein